MTASLRSIRPSSENRAVRPRSLCEQAIAGKDDLPPLDDIDHVPPLRQHDELSNGFKYVFAL